MKNINNNIFVSRFPHLDIHGENRASAEYIIRDFVNDNFKLGNEYIVIIHGKGQGILKNIVHKILSEDKRVIEHKLDNHNLGSTIVHLKLDKE